MQIHFSGDIIKNLFKAVAVLSIFSISTRLLGFVYKIYLGRQIASSDLGAYTIALSVAMVFVTALTSGVPLVISREVAGNISQSSNKKAHSIVSAGLVICLILGIFLSICIALGKPLFGFIFTDSSSYFILIALIPFIIFSGIYSPFKGYLWGKEDYFSVSLVEFIEQIIKIIICVICFSIIDSNSAVLAGVSISIACTLSTLFGILLYKRKKGRFSNPIKEINPLIKSTAPLTLVRFLGSLLVPLISILLPLRLMAGGFSNEQALSLIGVSMGMVMPLMTIPSTLTGSLSMALIPQLSILQKENNNSALSHQINSSFMFTIVCTFFILPMFIGIGEPICTFLFDNTSAGCLLAKYAIMIVPTGISQISTSILNSLGREKYTFVTYAIGGILLFIGILVLTPYLGIDAFFISMLLNSIIVSTLNIIKIKKITDISTKFIYKMIVLLIIVIALSLLCNKLYNLLIFIFPMFISIAISCIAGAIGYLALILALNIVDHEYINMFKKRLKHE